MKLIQIGLRIVQDIVLCKWTECSLEQLLIVTSRKVHLSQKEIALIL